MEHTLAWRGVLKAEISIRFPLPFLAHPPYDTASRLLKKSACFVLASLRGSTRRELLGGRKHWRDLSVHQDPFKGRTAHTKCGTYLLASSLAAALPGTRRVSARQGWAGEKAGLFELPAWCVQVFQGCRPVKSQHAKRVYSQPARESWPSRVTHATVQRTAVGSQNVPLDHIVADQGSYRFPESDPEREALVAM